MCLVLAVLLAACTPESLHPLSDADKAVIDQRLTGFWSGKIDRETAFVHFLPKDKSEMDIIAVSHTEDGNASWSAFTMFTSHVGDEWYMNIRGLVDNGKPFDGDPTFVLCRYRISNDGVLTVWGMSEKAAIEDIKDGKVKGEIRKGRWFNKVNPVPRTYVRGFGALPLQGGRNIHPRAYARGVLWYGVKITSSTDQLAKHVRRSDPEKLFGNLLGSLRRGM